MPEDGGFKNLNLIFLSDAYYRGMDDCLDVMLYALGASENLVEMKQRVEQMQVLVKNKRFELLRADLGVIGKSPF